MRSFSERSIGHFDADQTEAGKMVRIRLPHPTSSNLSFVSSLITSCVNGALANCALQETGSLQSVGGYFSILGSTSAIPAPSTIQVMSDVEATPLPPTWTTMLLGLGALCALGWRRKQKAAAAA